MILVWSWYCFGRFGYCFGMILVWFWYGFGMVWYGFGIVLVLCWYCVSMVCYCVGMVLVLFGMVWYGFGIVVVFVSKTCDAAARSTGGSITSFSSYLRGASRLPGKFLGSFS